jgi:hypothetical protein
MTQPIRILTFTPVWQRPEVFKICIKGIKRMMKHDPKRFKIIPFFMVSESSAADLLMKEKMKFIYTQNSPLGTKKNLGLTYALENFEFDYLMEIGSDDLVVSDYLDTVEGFMYQGIPQFHPADVYFIDSRTGKTAYWITDKVLGAARCINRSSLEFVTRRTTLWDNTGVRGMDTFSWNTLMRFGIGNRLIMPNNGEVMAVDIKSATNINQMSAFKPSPLPIESILQPFPEAADIYKLIEQNTAATIL